MNQIRLYSENSALPDHILEGEVKILEKEYKPLYAQNSIFDLPKMYDCRLIIELGGESKGLNVGEDFEIFGNDKDGAFWVYNALLIEREMPLSMCDVLTFHCISKDGQTTTISRDMTGRENK